MNKAVIAMINKYSAQSQTPLLSEINDLIMSYPVVVPMRL